MALDRRTFLRGSAVAAATVAWPASAEEQTSTVQIAIDTRQTVGPLPHIWEECAGSDRAAITLRESWRRDLDRWTAEAGLKRVRFHGILNDELGVFAPSIISHDKKPNFQNVDQVYDGLVARGVSPFVELSFVPKYLASGNQSFGFYAGNITPPASNDDWASFIKTFAGHLADRYGLPAVKTWLFEVWNEPNLPFFWTGTQQQYFDFYKATAVALKSIDPQMKVGGPATARAEWLSEFLSYCAQNNAPVDFISTHVYAGDNQKTLFGATDRYPQTEVIPEAVRRARQKIDATSFKGRPMWLSEWSSDSPAMIAHVVTECLPHCQATSHWVLSGTYEELGVADFILKEGDNGWSTMVQGIAKPSFNTYKLLHGLGRTRLAARGPALASKRPDGSLAALVWNLAEVEQAAGIPGQSRTRKVTGDAKRLEVTFNGASPGQRVGIRYVDQERGSPMPAWREMASPQYIKPDQLQLLRKRAEIPPAETRTLDASGRIVLDLPAEGVALIETA